MTWAVDLNAGGAAVLIALLTAHRLKIPRHPRPDKVAVDLWIFIARRFDLAANRTRAINRLAPNSWNTSRL
ncbi:IS110 family transposase [Actinacidiphila guanduensis]|uniref:Transposase n=1 Tax=Actinacidiphila guanduensis TaxID=310781 RepID=A0A1H0SL22_9ACTN|nr:IS110 family transposase [Actinacidiphila guanduensis]SDP41846.1 hypothetical protein SAMN05216259_12859 [Actinacidiphila guanduensis]